MNNIGFGEIGKFNVFIENSRGSRNKYETYGEHGMLRLDFVFNNGLTWPYNYGEILGTLGGDGDKLDAIVISTEVIDIGILTECRAIGMAEVVDRGEEDNKIICVPVEDRDMKKIQDFADLEKSWEEKIRNFLGEVAKQKNKKMDVMGFFGKEKAEEYIQKSVLK